MRDPLTCKQWVVCTFSDREDSLPSRVTGFRACDKRWGELSNEWCESIFTLHGYSLCLPDSSGQAVFLLFICYVGASISKENWRHEKMGERGSLGDSLKNNVCGNNSDLSRLEVLFCPRLLLLIKLPLLLPSLLLLPPDFFPLQAAQHQAVRFHLYLPSPGCSSPFNCSLSICHKIKSK